MFATDILEVLYSPQKVFKKITQNPKYWAPLLVAILFVAAETGLYYAQDTKTYYEKTAPVIGQPLTLWTQNVTYWSASPDTTFIVLNDQDYFNTTFYGNSSLQFGVANSSSLSMNLKNFTAVDCGSEGYPDLYLQLKFVAPQTSPTSATLYLYSSDADYFQYDLTSSFSTLNLTEWNNFTIPVGPSAADWQSTGNADWTNINSLRIELTYPQETTISLRIGGLFFRGLYVTPIDVFGQSYFAANAVLSGLFSFVTQWLVLAAVVYVMIRALKGTVTWRPLFIAVGVASIVSVIQVLITIAATTTLPGMIKYPFEFGGMFQISYAQTSLAMFSTASQAIYNSTIAPAINTYIWVSTIAFIAVYAWLAVLTSTIIRAVTDFSWKKSTLTAAVSIVLSYVLISVINVLLQL